MNDLINRILRHIREKGKNRSTEVLLRFFKIYYHISMSSEVLEKRLTQLQ